MAASADPENVPICACMQVGRPRPDLQLHRPDHGKVQQLIGGRGNAPSLACSWRVVVARGGILWAWPQKRIGAERRRSCTSPPGSTIYLQFALRRADSDCSSTSTTGMKPPLPRISVAPDPDRWPAEILFVNPPSGQRLRVGAS